MQAEETLFLKIFLAFANFIIGNQRKESFTFDCVTFAQIHIAVTFFKHVFEKRSLWKFIHSFIQMWPDVNPTKTVHQKKKNKQRKEKEKKRKKEKKTY